MARKINVSFKEIDKEIKLYETILDTYSDKSAFMKEAALFYLEYLKNKSVGVRPMDHIINEDPDEIMGIVSN